MPKSKKSTFQKSVFQENQVMIMFESMNDGISIIAEKQRESKEDFNIFKVEIKSELIEFK